ncbi:alpha/beta hydrolase [Clostridium gasigenes]|uniref:alpha/beta fold hydrolase n=1 Tax=Clostridium gasigenes TaxID=94869 RepID=UPI001C0D0111|nr:alpha/beta hydrolase [Clostridium gasigenes]MBU3137866.1 alpha/beta hydrolase [Clostridium gasigenes]
MFSIVIGTIIGLLLIMLFILWLWSPGKLESYLDENGNILNGSVSEIARVEVGGLEQGMIIKGKKDTNPVLLFLHGGPGNPEYVLAKEYNINLEDYFTVCWWEQRGSGMSYYSSIEKESITLDQMISDTVEVTNYLRERFGKEKIYIMGHSWGSFLGINAIDRYPELYEAYLGIGQVVNQFESEKLGYELMLSTAKANADEKSIKNLKKFTLNTPEDITTDYLMVRSSIMNEQGYGVFHMPKSKSELLRAIFKAKEYTLKDKYGYAAGSLLSLGQPMNHSMNITNLDESIKELKVPVYIFHGIYDKQVSYDIALKYYEGLKAPKKQFYKFENSAHSPFMEEADKFIGIIKEDILGVSK